MNLSQKIVGTFAEDDYKNYLRMNEGLLQMSLNKKDLVRNTKFYKLK